jgi:hypothetical protein
MSDDTKLHAALVDLALTLGVERYTGQHQTVAAHEFAFRVKKVIEAMNDGEIKAWVYFGSDPINLEHTVQDLIDRGGKIISASIAYGPSPAKIAGNLGPVAPDSWTLMVVLDTKELTE